MELSGPNLKKFPLKKTHSSKISFIFSKKVFFLFQEIEHFYFKTKKPII